MSMDSARPATVFRGGVPLGAAVAWLGLGLPVCLASTFFLVGENAPNAGLFFVVFGPIMMVRTWFAWLTVFRPGVAIEGGRIFVDNPTGSYVLDAQGAVIHRTNDPLPWAGRTVIRESPDPGARTVAAAALGKRWLVGRDVEAEFLVAATDAGAALGEKLTGMDWLRMRRRRGTG